MHIDLISLNVSDLQPISVGRQYSRELSGGNTGPLGTGSFDFTPNYVWNQGGGGGRPVSTEEASWKNCLKKTKMLAFSFFSPIS